MLTDNQELGHTAATRPGPIDFAFLAQQTFDDRDLTRDVLGLFVAQSRRVVPTLGALSSREQADAAHLLSGSARGIGAWAAAVAATAYEASEPSARGDLHLELATAFAAVETAITAYLERSVP